MKIMMSRKSAILCCILFSIFCILLFKQVHSEEPIKSVNQDTEDTTALPAGMKMVFVKGGCYEMGDTFEEGDTEELPVHGVCLNDFYMSATEVKIGEFRVFVNSTGYKTEAQRGDGVSIWDESKWTNKPGTYWDNTGLPQSENHPVTGVTWNDALAFTKWLSRKTGQNYRLPTEAEWEYAARSGGKKYKYSWGNGMVYMDDKMFKKKPTWRGSYEKHDDMDMYVYTSPVGIYKPNELGLYDMTGNIWEWCADWYDENYYKNSPKENPSGPETGKEKILRGGSWSHSQRYVRCSSRFAANIDFRSNLIGFRVVRSDN